MLLDARKHPLLERAYVAYGRQLLRRAFARVWVGGAPWPAGGGPVIAFVNHSAWWDPVLATFLSHDVFRGDAYGLMDGAQLLRYPFFRRVGCFGATMEHPAEDARGLALYAARLLGSSSDGGAAGGPGALPRALWIFPQGVLLPARVPLAFRSGLARFSRAVPDALLVPVAVRYEVRAAQRPECFVRVGAAAHASSGEAPARLTRRLEHRLRDELERLDADLAAPHPAGYRVVLAGRESLSDFYDRTMGRLRGRPAE